MRGQVSVDDTAGGTVIVAAVDENSQSWRQARIKNTDASATVYIQWTTESDALTAANGYALAAGEEIVIDRSYTFKDDRALIKGITSTGSVTVAYVVEDRVRHVQP